MRRKPNKDKPYYPPDEVEFIGGSRDGEVVPFEQVGYCKFYGTAPHQVYVWRADPHFKLAMMGSKIKRLRMIHVTEEAFRNAQTKPKG